MMRKDSPIYEMMVNDTTKGQIIKNANSSVDYGTQVVDIAGNVRTSLTVSNGRLRLIKYVDGVQAGYVDIASVP